MSAKLILCIIHIMQFVFCFVVIETTLFNAHLHDALLHPTQSLSMHNYVNTGTNSGKDKATVV